MTASDSAPEPTAPTRRRAATRPTHAATPGRSRSSPSDRTDAEHPHENAVSLVGELAAEPAVRTLPSGDEVTTFRLTVRVAERARRRVDAGPSVGVHPSLPRVATMRSDSVECAVWKPLLRSRLARCAVGDVLAVTGALHHRYWRGTAGLASRYEVEVENVRTVVKATAVKAKRTAGPSDRRTDA